MSPIHFLCFGVPRSGTTLLGQILNAHPLVICGIERFSFATFAPELLTREGFEADTLAATGEAKRRANRFPPEKLARAIALGDKLPRAYFHLDDIVGRFDALRLLYVVRPIGEVALSWDRRAGNDRDRSWQRGQTGVFAAIDHYLCLKILLKRSADADLLVVPYPRLTSALDNEGEVDKIFAFLQAGRADDVRGFLRTSAVRSAELAAARGAAGPSSLGPELEAFFLPVDRALETLPVCSFDELRPHAAAAAACVDAAVGGFAALLAERLLGQGAPARAYLERMEKRYRKTAAAVGSTVIEALMEKAGSALPGRVRPGA